MTAHLPSIFAAGLGLLAGFLMARGNEAGRSEVRELAPASTKSRPQQVPEKDSTVRLPKVEHTLSALLTLDRGRLNRDETDRKLMAASHGELKTLLAGLIGLDKSQPSLDVLNLRNQIIREIYHREGPSSLEAAEQLGDPETLGEFINCLAADDALAAADWLERFKQVIRDHNPTLAGDELAHAERHELLSVLWRLYNSALSQGPEVGRALLERLDGNTEMGGGANSLPDDFDHGKFFEGLEPREVLRVPGTTDLFESWAAHDRDSALALALRAAADAPPGSVDLTFSVFQGVCKLEGEEAAAAWLSEFLASLPESERARILSRFFEHRHPPSPAAYRDVLAGLGNDADRIHFGATVLNPHLPAEQFVPYLDGIPSMDLRAGILEASSREWAVKPRSDEQSASYRARFEALAAAAGITGEARARVMAPWP
jgi:hypothetical protein